MQDPVHARRLQELEALVERQVAALLGGLRAGAGLRHADQRRVHEYVALVARKRPVDDLPLHRFRYAAVPLFDPLERYVLGHDTRRDVQQRVGRPAVRVAVGRAAGARGPAAAAAARAVPAARPLVGDARAAAAARPLARRRHRRYDAAVEAAIAVAAAATATAAAATVAAAAAAESSGRRTRITRTQHERVEWSTRGRDGRHTHARGFLFF